MSGLELSIPLEGSGVIETGEYFFVPTTQKTVRETYTPKVYHHVVDRVFYYEVTEQAQPITYTLTLPPLFTRSLPAIEPPRIEGFVIDRQFFAPPVNPVRETTNTFSENQPPIANSQDIFENSPGSNFAFPQNFPNNLEIVQTSTLPRDEIVQDRQPVIENPASFFLPVEQDFTSNGFAIAESSVNSDLNTTINPNTPVNLPFTEEVVFKNSIQTRPLTIINNVTNYYTNDTTFGIEISTRFNQTKNVTYNLRNERVLKSKLCGFPPFCSSSAVDKCHNITIKDCSECDMVSTAFIGTYLSILGLLILFGNLLVIWNVLRKKRGFADKYNKIKASLAVADLLTAVQIFGIAIPYFTWTLGLTIDELDYKQLGLRGTPSAFAGGIFDIFTIVLSMFHLLFMGQQRLYAIRWPIKYKTTKNKTPTLGITLVWISALIFASAPAFFQEYFTYTYFPAIFLYLPAFKQHKIGDDFKAGIIIATFLYVFPYVIMTGLVITAWYFGRKYIKEASNLSHHHSNVHNRNAKDSHSKEKALLKTVLLMQVAFTVTVLPQFICMVMFYAGVFNCDTISLPYFISFSFGMANSFANVLVYSIRDPNFRKSFKDVCANCWFKTLGKKSPNVEQNQANENSNNSNTSTHTKKSWIAHWSQHLRRKSAPSIQV